MPNFKNFEERQEFLRRVAEIHDEWTEKHANDEDVFDPSHAQPHNGNTDYPIFYLDRSAPADVEKEYFDKVEELKEEFARRNGK